MLLPAPKVTEDILFAALCFYDTDEAIACFIGKSGLHTGDAFHCPKQCVGRGDGVGVALPAGETQADVPTILRKVAFFHAY